MTMLSSIAQPLAVPKSQTYDGVAFPLAYECVRSDVTLAQICDWITENRQQLLEQATQSGAVLLRGFPVPGAEDFDAVVAALGLENFPYKKSLSNAVRINFTERVFSANEAPADVKIFLHHEMAQTPFWPAFIMFFCELAAEQGGATPLCRSDILYDRLKAEIPVFVADLESKGLKYSNVMPDSDDPQSGMGRSWQSTLGVDSKEQAERRLEELRYSWEWLEGNALRATTPVLPGVREVSPGRRTLFNQLIAAYAGWKDTRNDPSSAIRFGDGTILDAQAVARLISLADELSFDMPWQGTDVVIVDNTVAMHGRRTFVGKRKVLASLAEMRTHGLN
ncbi:MAG: TauD/TfdA family dioxygenase [Planctomycetales bacterium]|nr:TauD/TfdA family dioxygenase [Planctomycetales bacterium]